MSIAAPIDADGLAVIYLARGADTDPLARFRRFVHSYRQFNAGVPHDLGIIFKGFNGPADLARARELFKSLNHQALFTSDDRFDLGAYADAARQLPHARLCFLNSNSEILCDGWLARLAANLAMPRVGLVGATGSFESLPAFPSFPNPHIRSNAFMIRRDLFLEMLSGFQLTTKVAAYAVESGPNGVTRQIFERGLSALVVGRDGRGYSPSWWPHSQTFRQGSQANLLVHDNVTRLFENLPFEAKVEISQRSWGEFIQPYKRL